MHGKASATVIIDCLIPTASDTQVPALGDDVDKPLVMEAVKQFRGLVGGMVVHHDDIELEVRLLLQRAIDGIKDRLLAVIDRDDHRGLDVKALLVEVRATVEARIYLRTDGSKVGSSRMLHFYLHLTVAGIHIIKLFHARCPEVGLFFGIKAFVDME